MAKSPKITRIETFHHGEYPNLAFVKIHTDDGLFGVGETPGSPAPVHAFIHADAAEYLLGKDASQLDLHWSNLAKMAGGMRSRGAEMRALSAIDIALWDLFGKRVGEPVYNLLGGLSRNKIKVYNTCVGYPFYMDRTEGPKPGSPDYVPKGPYDDAYASLIDPVGLAESLHADGFRAMKIWPFSQFAAKTNGQFISLEDLEAGTEPFRLIHEAMGDQMEVAVEMTQSWNLPSAIKIAQAVTPFKPLWFEDAVQMDNLDALAQFRTSTNIPTIASEGVSTRWSFREMFVKQATDICMFDLGWVGGISEAKRVATMAESFGIPIAPHDCVGPIAFMAGVHLSLNATNTYIQETVRSYRATWYNDIVTALPKVEDGFASVSDAPGLGLDFTEKFLKSDLLTVQVSEL
ncbi:MAG: mandelate racemase/muconate lactonizing enzyme family protein [Chloroflexi bacterium]|nr:mandelate racemase/muconate lactonizing enzyme family protein [Chloroflexota bacterium]MBT4072296.1 mandelate racemase/muconate lactonizing enzyme family protein [Chloroflexota bacterium]MBT4514010.1 mandelate racemase/muconate lactonizing enzyme family protein [Chloroflexota bacterium]MBT5320567.1 mandelate racemase/muconate lactonizing enzyme family protein [Chloroflexota bacterium]MBT6681636.1 mandelate racemase/muconate lactonizing enzyme family protein [Chloroflexota bacterium]